jgi:hypothetical protein
MTPGDQKYFSGLVANLDVRDGTLKCLCCDRYLKVSFGAATSDYYLHFRSKKHAKDRENLPDDIDGLILSRVKQVQKDEAKAAVAQAAAFKASEKKRKATNFPVSGEMLDEIVAEMEALMQMMEPYYKQADADNEAEALVRRIKAISGAPDDL